MPPDPLAPRVIIGSSFPQIVQDYIHTARTSIDIIIYDWRLYDRQPTNPAAVFTAALCAAAQRGVRVRALVSSASLLDRLDRMGIKAKVLHSGKIVHAKVMIIDNSRVILGSHNYTQSAFTANLEVSLSILSSSACGELSAYFSRLWGA